MTGIDVKLLTLILFSILMFAQPGYSQDTANPSANIKSADSISKGLQIDTVVQQNLQSVQSVIDTVKSVDSLIAEKTPENAMTNTKLFIYILLSVLGLALFFFIFVITLFKTFHKKKSTRQSLLLSWNLFFIVSIIWLFIVWGLVAGFWTVASFMIVMIFLFIISLIMTIIALKSK
jgi:hypothetical protein